MLYCGKGKCARLASSPRHDPLDPIMVFQRFTPGCSALSPHPGLESLFLQLNCSCFEETTSRRISEQGRRSRRSCFLLWYICVFLAHSRLVLERCVSGHFFPLSFSLLRAAQAPQPCAPLANGGASAVVSPSFPRRVFSPLGPFPPPLH